MLSCAVVQKNAMRFTGTILAALLLGNTLLAAPSDPATFATEHYEVYAEHVDRWTLTSLLEQYYSILKDANGYDASEKLKVKIYSSRERWAAALAADGVRRASRR